MIIIFLKERIEEKNSVKIIFLKELIEVNILKVMLTFKKIQMKFKFFLKKFRRRKKILPFHDGVDPNISAEQAPNVLPIQLLSAHQ